MSSLNAFRIGRHLLKHIQGRVNFPDNPFKTAEEGVLVVAQWK